MILVSTCPKCLRNFKRCKCERTVADDMEILRPDEELEK